MIIESATRAIRLYAAFPLQLSLIAAVAWPASLLNYLLSDRWYSFLLQLFAILISNVLFAAQVHAANDAIAGDPPSFARTYRWLVSRFGRIVEFGARYFAAGFLLLITIVGIPWSIRLFVRWFFAQYEVVIADREPKQAISESCVLVGGRWWATAGRLIAPYLVIAVPSVAVWLFIPLVGWYFWSPIAGLLISPILAAYFTNLYLEYKSTAQRPSDTTTTAVPQ